MTDITLRYSGSSAVEPTDSQQAHDITDALLSAVSSDVMELGYGKVRENGGVVEFNFTIGLKTTLNNSEAAIDSFAQELVDLGIEPDVEAAKENIEV